MSVVARIYPDNDSRIAERFVNGSEGYGTEFKFDSTGKCFSAS